MPANVSAETALTSDIFAGPCAAGVAVSSDGQWLVVANYYNDSMTVFTGGLGHWTQLSTLMAEEPGNLENEGELDLRPGKDANTPQPGKPGGNIRFGYKLRSRSACQRAVARPLGRTSRASATAKSTW